MFQDYDDPYITSTYETRISIRETWDRLHALGSRGNLQRRRGQGCDTDRRLTKMMDGCTNGRIFG